MTNRHQSLLSPLRYPGSKRRLVNYIKQALKMNELHPALYVEPFVGGASVALQLMQDELVDKVILMDRDPWVASFWQTVFFDTAWLIKQIETVEVTLEVWQQFKNLNPKTTRDQALTCFFLNRTSFSGILEKRAGPLGGKSQESAYKIDCRFPRTTLIQRIEQAAQYQDKVHGVWNCSWEEGMKQMRVEQNAGNLPVDHLFCYFDPPFFEKADALYRWYFTHEDHCALRDFLLELDDQWILSYDSAQQVELLYGNALKHRTNGAQKHSLELSYTLGIMSKKRKQGREVIISNLLYLPKLTELK
ncbi:MAG: DNA adenine methylase [Anaerolineae bacterium]|nr:DNA adenine methylase [Anaerolineae bacterium]